MYHVELRELRQLGQRAWSFNLTERELRSIVEPWAREQPIDFAERKWSTHVAAITILEGEHLSLQQLAMGKGWRNAERRGENVTDRVLSAARARDTAELAPGAAGVGAPDASPAVAGAPSTGVTTVPPESPSAESDLQADSLGLGLLSLLEEAPAPLSRAWRLAQARFPERSASASLAVAERAVTALLEKRLIALERRPDGDPAAAAEGSGSAADAADESGGQLLHAVDSWADTDDPPAVEMRRR